MADSTQFTDRTHSGEIKWFAERRQLFSFPFTFYLLLTLCFLLFSLPISLPLSSHFPDVVSHFLPAVSSAYVEQPSFLTGYSGNTPTLQCTLQQSNSDKIYWYWQQGGRELEWLFYSYEDHLVNFTAEPRTALRRNKK
ncbi:unnamed protein product [Lepidochelys kempii]